MIRMIKESVALLMQQHKNCCEKWDEGEAVEVWQDNNGITCVRYASGKWWHYDDEKGEWW